MLTAEGQRRVAADTVLEPERLARALAALPEARRVALLDAVESLAEEAERTS